MMDELNALNAPKKVVDGLTEVFEGLAQMFEGVSDQLELLGADAVPEGKRIFPVVDQKAPAVSEKKGSAAPHPRRKPIKKTRKVEEAVDKPEDPVNDSDSDAGADTQLEAENSVGEAEDRHPDRSGYGGLCRLLSGICPMEGGRGVHHPARHHCQDPVRLLAAGAAGVHRTDLSEDHEQVRRAVRPDPVLPKPHHCFRRRSCGCYR